MRHRRRGQRAQHRPDPGRRPEAARIPRLRLLRRRLHVGRRPAARAQHRARGRARGAGRSAEHLAGSTGIAHTRWATHGAPAVHNAHPHFRMAPRRRARRATRLGIGAAAASRWCTTASSRTTTSCAPSCSAQGLRLREPDRHRGDRPPDRHLYDGDLFEAVQRAVPRLHGAYAIAVFCRDEPHRVVGARQGSPLVLGVGTRRAARTSSPPTRWRWPA